MLKNHTKAHLLRLFFSFLFGLTLNTVSTENSFQKSSLTNSKYNPSTLNPLSPVFYQEPNHLYFVARGKPAKITCKAGPVVQLVVKCNGQWVAPNLHTSSENVDTKTGLRIFQVTVDITREDLDEVMGNSGSSNGGQSEAINSKNQIQKSQLSQLFRYPSSSIDSMKLLDENGYFCECFAINTGSGLNSTPITVRSRKGQVVAAYLRKRFDQEPLNSIVEIGSTAHLQCLPPDGLPQPDVFWLKDGELIDASKDHNYIISNEASLIISQTRLSDSGNYSCGVVNMAGKRLSEMAILSVYVNGMWSSWSQWSECSQMCTKGQQKRTRSCTDPAPLNGGRYCPGESIQKMSCHIVCSIDGFWSAWSAWSNCNQDCFQHRRRYCDNPPPQNQGNDCHGSDIETSNCTGFNCKNGLLHTHDANQAVDVDRGRIAMYTGIIIAGIVFLSLVMFIAYLLKKHKSLLPNSNYKQPAILSHMTSLLVNNNSEFNFNKSVFGQASKSSLLKKNFKKSKNNNPKNILINSTSLTSNQMQGNNNNIRCGLNLHLPPQPLLSIYNHSQNGKDHKNLNLQESLITNLFPNNNHSYTTNNNSCRNVSNSSENAINSNGTNNNMSNKHNYIMSDRSKNNITNDNKNVVSRKSNYFNNTSNNSSLSSSQSGSPCNSDQMNNFNRDSVICFQKLLPQSNSSGGCSEYSILTLKTNAPEDYTNGSVFDKRMNTSTTETPLSNKTAISNLSGSNRENYDNEKVAIWASINRTGGRISLPEAGIKLTIPEEAIADKQVVDVFLAVSRDNKNRPKLSTSQTILSDYVMCGPSDIQLLKPVILTLPHCASMNHGRWDISAYSGTMQSNNECSWHEICTLGKETLNTNVYVQLDQNECHILTDSLSDKYAIVGVPSQYSAKKLRLAAFAPRIPSLLDFNVRIYFIDDTPDSIQSVMLEESKLGGILLDETKEIQFQYGNSNLCLSIEDLNHGWKCKMATNSQEIPFRHIWNGAQNGLHCSFTLEQIDSDQQSLSCSIRVFQTGNVSSGQLLKILHYIEKNVATNVSQNSITYQSITPLLNPLIQSDFQTKNYFRLHSDVKKILCSLLDPPNITGNDWRRLAERLNEDRYINYFATKLSPTEHILNLWEARCKDARSIDHLINSLRSMNRFDALSIIESQMKF